MGELNHPSLDDVILALQKSISRVSYKTRKHLDSADGPPEGVAMVEGNIAWSIEFQSELDGDRLMVLKDGDVGVQLSGIISVPVTYTDAANDEE